MSKPNDDQKNKVANIAKDIWKVAKLSAVFVGVAYLGTCLSTPKLHEDVASGDFWNVDQVIAGKVTAEGIKDPVVQKVAIELRNNFSNTSGEMSHQAQNELQSLCEPVCVKIVKPMSVCIGGPCSMNYTQTSEHEECSRPATCTNDMHDLQNHLESVEEAGYLTAERFPIYMARYKDPGLTVWQKTGLWYAFAVLAIIALFGALFGFRRFRHWRENKVIAKVDAEMEKAKEKTTYRVTSPAEQLSPQSIRIALEHKLLDEEIHEAALEAEQILKRRAATP